MKKDIEFLDALIEALEEENESELKKLKSETRSKIKNMALDLCKDDRKCEQVANMLYIPIGDEGDMIEIRNHMYVTSFADMIISVKPRTELGNIPLGILDKNQRRFLRYRYQFKEYRQVLASSMSKPIEVGGGEGNIPQQSPLNKEAIDLLEFAISVLHDEEELHFVNLRQECKKEIFDKSEGIIHHTRMIGHLRIETIRIGNGDNLVFSYSLPVKDLFHSEGDDPYILDMFIEKKGKEGEPVERISAVNEIGGYLNDVCPRPKVINLLGKQMCVLTEGKHRYILPDREYAPHVSVDIGSRVKTTIGVPIETPEVYIKNLPPEEPNTFYLVSDQVFYASDRQDLLRWEANRLVTKPVVHHKNDS